MAIGFFYQEIAFVFAIAGFEGIADMFNLIGLKFFEIAGYITSINNDLGCPPPFP